MRQITRQGTRYLFWHYLDNNAGRVIYAGMNAYCTAYVTGSLDPIIHYEGEGVVNDTMVIRPFCLNGYPCSFVRLHQGY